MPRNLASEAFTTPPPRGTQTVAPLRHHRLMNMMDWLRELEREIERRVDVDVRRGSLTGSDELMECRIAPYGERVHFSIRGTLEDGDGSSDPDWMEPE